MSRTVPQWKKFQIFSGLAREDVKEMLKLLQKAANHRKIAEEQFLLIGNIFAKNGFVAKNLDKKTTHNKFQ